jgi:hypothetical protein
MFTAAVSKGKNMRRIITALLLILGFTIFISAQNKPPVPPADYGQWESLSTIREYGGLSPDGKWLAYGINRSNRDNELRVTNIADGTVKTAAFASQPVFSSDSRWVAYAIGYSEAQEEKMKKEKKPVQKKMGLLNLATGEQTVVDSIESFAFSPSGTYLAMRRYPPEKKETPEAAAPTETEDTPGAALLLRQLSSGRDASFGNVSEYAWQDLPKRGTLLAMTINAEDKTGNGIQIFNSETAAVRVLDSSASIYSGLAWRKRAPISPPCVRNLTSTAKVPHKSRSPGRISAKHPKPVTSTTPPLTRSFLQGCAPCRFISPVGRRIVKLSSWVWRSGTKKSRKPKSPPRPMPTPRKPPPR